MNRAELEPPNSAWDRLAARIRLLTDPGRTERERAVVTHPTIIHPGNRVWVRLYVCEYVLHLDRGGDGRVTVLDYDYIETRCVDQADVRGERSRVETLTVDNDGEWVERRAADET